MLNEYNMNLMAYFCLIWCTNWWPGTASELTACGLDKLNFEFVPLIERPNSKPRITLLRYFGLFITMLHFESEKRVFKSMKLTFLWKIKQRSIVLFAALREP